MDRVIRVKVSDESIGTIFDEVFNGYDHLPDDDIKMVTEKTEAGAEILIWYTEKPS